MSYIISEDGKELLKDVRDFCVNEVKEQVKEYDISGEWPKCRKSTADWDWIIWIRQPS